MVYAIALAANMGGQLPPECPGQFAPEWVVSLKRNGVVTFIRISSGAAAQYLNVLRQRACRNPADFNTATGMMLTTASMNDVFDEYARELCGEYSRWALLKREKAFETRLATYNATAASNFNPAIHYNRPIPFGFLGQITNAGEFGTNGY